MVRMLGTNRMLNGEIKFLFLPDNLCGTVAHLRMWHIRTHVHIPSAHVSETYQVRNLKKTEAMFYFNTGKSDISDSVCSVDIGRCIFLLS